MWLTGSCLLYLTRERYLIKSFLNILGFPCRTSIKLEDVSVVPKMVHKDGLQKDHKNSWLWRLALCGPQSKFAKVFSVWSMVSFPPVRWGEYWMLDHFSFEQEGRILYFDVAFYFIMQPQKFFKCHKFTDSHCLDIFSLTLVFNWS